MKKLLLRIVLSLFIVAGVAAMVAVYKYDLLPLQHAVCSANQCVELPLEIYIENYRGKSILKYPSNLYLDSVLIDFPQMEKVSAKIDPKGIVNFDYALKRPIALINLDKVYGLTARGELVPAVAEDLPILIGISGGKYRLYHEMPENKIGYALKLIELVGTLSPEFKKELSEINLNHPSGLAIHLRHIRPELILGRGEELKKLLLVERIAGFLNTLDEDVYAIDFRYENQLVLKKTS